MLMAEYAIKFEELARFSLSVVPIDKARKSKFMHGLKTKTVKYVDSVATGPLTYAKAVQ